MASGAEEDETLICRACGKPLREGEPCYRTLDKKRFNAIPAHHYDLILCDLRMTEIDGQQFYREVQNRYPDATSRSVHDRAGES